MIALNESTLRFLTAGLLVGGLSFASIASAAKINITIETDATNKTAIEEAVAGEAGRDVEPIFPVTLEVDEDTVTVGYLKDRMQEKTNIDPDFQVFHFKGKKLEGDDKLKDYGIKDQDKLDWKPGQG